MKNQARNMPPFQTPAAALVCLLSFGCAFSARAAVYHVDPGGSDAQDGLTPATAWRSLEKVNAAALAPGDEVRFKRGGIWRGTLRVQSGAPGKPLYYGAYGEGPKPILQNSVDRSRPADWEPCGTNLWTTRADAPLARDIGIFIGDHGARWGWKKWSQAACTNALDFWHDPDGQRVVVNLPQNPGLAFASIELAQTGHVVNEGGRHDVVYEDLAVRYGASHGFGGGDVHRVAIRRCDIYWIGGGLQFWKDKAKRTGPVRFGNGIEFWGHATHCLVERCRLWQIYDAALTNQSSKDPRAEDGIVFRDNQVWNCEYSFEIWNHNPKSAMRNVLFEHNTCVNAGEVWSHAQRPNPNGSHVLVSTTPCPCTNIVFRNNVFCRTTEWSTRFRCGGIEGLVMDHNLFYIPENLILNYNPWPAERKAGFPAARTKYGPGEQEFARYRATSGYDAHSVWAEPAFADPVRHDYRLKPGTPGSTAATDGGPLGARGGE